MLHACESYEATEDLLAPQISALKQSAARSFLRLSESRIAHDTERFDICTLLTGPGIRRRIQLQG